MLFFICTGFPKPETVTEDEGVRDDSGDQTEVQPRVVMPTKTEVRLNESEDGPSEYQVLEMYGSHGVHFLTQKSS